MSQAHWLQTYPDYQDFYSIVNDEYYVDITTIWPVPRMQ